MGVIAFANALLVIPKVLAQNGGFDPQVSNFLKKKKKKTFLIPKQI